jgi:hypothetical protein
MGEGGVSEPVKLVGVGASEGAVVGPAFAHFAEELKPERESTSKGEVENELERFRGERSRLCQRSSPRLVSGSVRRPEKRKRLSSMPTSSWPETPSSLRRSRSACGTL